jgi:hypothetical protein
MKKLFRVLTLLLLISFISPYGYSSEIVRVKNIKSDKSIYRPNVTEILELIEEGDEEYWYGMYFADEKIGWFQIQGKIYESENFNQEIVEMIGNMNLTFEMMGNEDKSVEWSSEIQFREIYQARPPFRLISYHEATQTDGLLSSVIGEKKGNRFKLEYKDNNEKNVREILLTNFNYSLYDVFVIDAWFKKKLPEVNDMIVSRTFDFQTLKYHLNESTIQEIVKSKVNGVDYIYYKVNSLDKGEVVEEDFAAQFLIDQEGVPIKFFTSGMELRLESEIDAKKINQPSNIFVDAGLVIENSFPDNFYDKYAEMIIYEIIGDDSLISKKGHQEYKILDNGVKLLTVGTHKNQDLFLNMESATIDQRKYYLEDTPGYPHKSKIIVDLSKQALQGEKDDMEKIYKLAKFVDDYIEDDYESNANSIFDIIERKRGDCSEHALLFTNLARAAGFPAREVGGWAYDGIGKFMPHAWVEVAIKANSNFYWLPVDPTWDSVNPTNVIKANDYESILGNFTLRLRKIRYEDGEEIILSQ